LLLNALEWQNPNYSTSLSLPKYINITPSYRSFQTTPPRNVIPPVVLIILTKTSKVVAAFLGRQARRWWQALPEEKRADYMGHANKHRKYLYGLLASVGIGSYVYYSTHIQETPITKRSRFVAFSDDQLEEMSLNEKRRIYVLVARCPSEEVTTSDGPQA